MMEVHRSGDPQICSNNWYPSKQNKQEDKKNERGKWIKTGSIEEARLFMAESARKGTDKLRLDIILDQETYKKVDH